MSLACKNFHSAEVGAGASGLAKASFGNVSTWVATANSSRSLRFLDVTIALRRIRITKTTYLRSEKMAFSNETKLTCIRCALSAAASTSRLARPQSWHRRWRHPFDVQTDAQEATTRLTERVTGCTTMQAVVVGGALMDLLMTLFVRSHQA